MPATPHFPTVASFTIWFAAAVLGASTLPAQDVLLHEVRADAAEHWVELKNRGGDPVDLSTWTLYQGTRTPGRQQKYWYRFPSGTTLAPGGLLRVHWYADPTTAPLPGELWTGTATASFLFGYGAEPLTGPRGALALVRGTLWSELHTAAFFVDWMAWGSPDFLLADLATQAGLWPAARCLPTIPAGHSLARFLDVVGAVPGRDREWFVDPTPTPSMDNAQGMALGSYATGCLVAGHHLLGQPTLRANGFPLLGEAGFGFTVDRTTGVFGETVLLAFAASAATPGLPSLLPPLPVAMCREAIDSSRLFGTLLVDARVMTTAMPFSLANLPLSLAGHELHVQAMVFDFLPNAWPPYQGLSNALRIGLGG
jgi:hypothetical protein